MCGDRVIHRATGKAFRISFNDAFRFRETQLLKAKSWKALDEDGLPARVWKQVWPVVKHWVLPILQLSLEQGKLSQQWWHAKIIGLEKPGKSGLRHLEDLETDFAVVYFWWSTRIRCCGENISFRRGTRSAASNLFRGARKHISAEQALMLVQEQTCYVSRASRVLSLIGFESVQRGL